ncbi:prepilin peptidase [Candidatus Saccharibacteria bacterium]|nr:prepilin peptidase [Candidatus Saccharibacteria bacterium]
MEPYYRILVLIILFFFGAILGSFACCQAWRIRLKELGKKSPGKWSVCLTCGKRLKTSENIPLLSWLAQRGKCKKCGAKIGVSEILSEFTFALALPAVGNVFYDQFTDVLAEGNFLKLAVLIFTALMLIVSISIMWILLIYDAKWQKLPTFLLTILNISAIIYLILQIVGLILNSAEISEIGVSLLKTLGAVAILPAPYFLLSTLSHEKLVGSGDWLVALPIALILGHWWLALIALFLANFLGSIFGVFQRVKKGARQIPFGPFLIFAFIIVYALQFWLLKLIVIV